MKTISQAAGKNYIKLILVSALISAASSTVAQKANGAIELASDVTGSGLGANLYVGATFIKGSSAISVGANLQRQKCNLSGMQMTYRYTVGHSENEKIELFFLGNITAHSAANMSKRCIHTEQICSKERSIDYNTLSLKVIESYIGFGIKYNLTQRLHVICSIGAGGYKTLNDDYDRKFYRPKSALGLRFRAGIAYSMK
ncbi:MAG: hypothetical protein V4580_16605 [Bacteroidota bacterium]